MYNREIFYGDSAQKKVTKIIPCGFFMLIWEVCGRLLSKRYNNTREMVSPSPTLASPMTHFPRSCGPLHVLAKSPLLGGEVPNLDGVPHSCEPNAWGGVFHDNMVVLALRDVAQNDALTMSTLWSPCETPIQYRRLRLGYDCDCARCVREAVDAPVCSPIDLQTLGVNPAWIRNPPHMKLFLQLVQMDITESTLSTRERLQAAVAGYSLRDIRARDSSKEMLQFLISEAIMLLCTTVCGGAAAMTEEEAGIAVSMFHHAFKYEFVASRSLAFQCAVYESAHILCEACTKMQLSHTNIFSALCNMSKVLFA